MAYLWNTCGILDYCTSEMKAFDERSQLLKFEVLETGDLDSAMLSPTTFFSTSRNIRNYPIKGSGFKARWQPQIQMSNGHVFEFSTT